MFAGAEDYNALEDIDAALVTVVAKMGYLAPSLPSPSEAAAARPPMILVRPVAAAAAVRDS